MGFFDFFSNIFSPNLSSQDLDLKLSSYLNLDVDASQYIHTPTVTLPQLVTTPSTQYSPVYQIGSPYASASGSSQYPTVIPSQVITPTVTPTQTVTADATSSQTAEQSAESAQGAGGDSLPQLLMYGAIAAVGLFVVYKVMTSPEGKRRVKKGAKTGAKYAAMM